MATGKKRATILDIAREAGVSTATVSRVLNNVDYPVKESARRLIREVAERLHYRPNIFGQMLKGGSNRIIGIIVPSITNPFYAQLVSDVEGHCIAAGYAPIICSSYNSPQMELRHLETLLRQQVAGIMLSTINNNAAFVGKLETSPAPLVLFDQPLEGFAGSGVAFDFRAGGQTATRHLVACGHRRIAFASQSVDRASRRLIFEGYREALRESGIRPTGDCVFTVADDPEAEGEIRDYRHGRLLARNILDKPYLPDAIVASNDMIAIGILNALSEQGVSVPNDVSLIGFDDIGFASMIPPGLTTVRQSTAKTAELAAAILFGRIDRPGKRAVVRAVEPELIERGSVRKRHPKLR